MGSIKVKSGGNKWETNNSKNAMTPLCNRGAQKVRDKKGYHRYTEKGRRGIPAGRIQNTKNKDVRRGSSLRPKQLGEN